MRNANKYPKIPYASMVKKMKKWSGIHMRIRITTKSQPLLEGHLSSAPAKFGRRPFPRSSDNLSCLHMTERMKDRTIT